MKTIISYIYYITNFLFTQSSVLTGFAIIIGFFLIVLIIDNEFIKKMSQYLLTLALISILIYLLLDSNLNLLTKGKFSIQIPHCQQVKSFENFVIEITQCQKSNSTVSLDFLIKNKGKTRDFYFYAKDTRIFDWFGNDNYTRKVLIGHGRHNISSRIRLPHNTPIKASIIFEDVLLESDTIALLEIKTNYNKNIKFNNILLSKRSKELKFLRN